MQSEKIRFFPKVNPSQEYKQDWSSAYDSAFPVNYRNGLMDKGKIYHQNGILKETFDLEVYDKLRDASDKRPLYCIDLLSAYGDSFLATVYGMSPEEIFDLWSSEEKSLHLPCGRRISCETLGVDISEPALDYGRRVGIFDNFMQCDINQLSESEQQRLANALNAAHFVHVGASGYINLDTFHFLIDSFASGDDFGILIVPVNYVFVKHYKEFQQYIVKKLDFINCVSGIFRYLLPAEKEYYNVSCAYSTTWVMERKKREACENSTKGA